MKPRLRYLNKLLGTEYILDFVPEYGGYEVTSADGSDIISNIGQRKTLQEMIAWLQGATHVAELLKKGKDS